MPLPWIWGRSDRGLMEEVFAYVAAGLVGLWGVAHAIPTRAVVAGFATPAAREPGPLVTRVRSRTVAKVDSIGFVVLRWIQCSAG